MRGLVFLVAALVGCSGSSRAGGTDAGRSSAMGAEGGACYPNGTCNGALACRSNLCVDLGSGAGAAANGGTSGGGTGGSATGGSGGTGPAVPGVDGGALDSGSTVVVDGGPDAGPTCRAIDVVVALASNPSMSVYLDRVQTEFNGFLNGSSRSAIDMRIVLISAQSTLDPVTSMPTGPVICIDPPTGNGSCPSDTNPPEYHHVMSCGGSECWVGTHNALDRVLYAYPDYKSALRMNSLKVVVAVTSGTAGNTLDFKTQAETFTASVEALDPGWFDRWKLFGIISPTEGGAYQMLADQTGGVTVDIASLDWSPLFDGIVASSCE